MSLLLFLFLHFLWFSLLIDYFHYLSVSRQHGCSHLSPPLLRTLPHLSSFGSGRNPLPSPPSFPSDGAVLVQTRAAQRLVASAGQCGALGGCVSLSPHLWDGLRLSVVSTTPAPRPLHPHRTM